MPSRVSKLFFSSCYTVFDDTSAVVRRFLCGVLNSDMPTSIHCPSL
jgi:hypothetical protein